MAKLSTLPLPELYERKITAATERVILSKEDFTCKSDSWCSKVCKLKNKNPPATNLLVPATHVDILVIQDYKAFDEKNFNYTKSGKSIEFKNQAIIGELFKDAGKDSTVTFHVTSLLKCQLEKEDLTKGKPPSLAVISKCKPYLLQEIENRKPKVIISLSTAASKVIAEKVTNNGNRGEILRTKTGIPLVLTLHPRILTMLRQNASGAFWGPDFYSIIRDDFTKAIALVKGTLQVPDLERSLEEVAKKITIARDIQAVGLMCDSLMELGLEGATLSYDLETNTIDPYGTDPYGSPAKIILVQFGFRNLQGQLESYVFPMWHRDNEWYDPDEAWDYLKPIISNPEVRKIGHNIKFDIRYTTVTTGVRPLGVVFDTMLLLHAINSGVQGQYSLKQAVWDWLPDFGLGNYEDRLPKLSKVVLTDEDEEFEEGDGTDEV